MLETPETSEKELERLPNARSLDDLVYGALKEAIVSHKLKAGAALVEAEIAAQLGVSKTPVRSALRRLEAERFVDKVAYGGTFVAEMSLEDVRDIYLVRAVLEGLTVRLATPLYTDDELQEMRSVLAKAEQAKDAGNMDRMRELGSEWHRLLRRPIRNRFLHNLLSLLNDHVERGRWLTTQDSGVAVKSIHEHRNILEAIQARQGEVAESLMRAHLMRVVEDFESTGPLETRVGKSKT